MHKKVGSVSSATTGLPVYKAEIRVLKADTTPAQLYSDNGITPLAQPVLADGLGEYSFYVADGSYTLVVADPGGANAVSFPDTEIYDLSEMAVNANGAAIYSAIATNQASIATAQAGLAGAAALSAGNSSVSASLAAATLGVYKSAASANVPQGAMAYALTPGSGGANGTNIAATFSGGNYIGNPTILFDIVAGAVANVRLLDLGLYIGGAISAPTVALPGSAGGAALTLTNGFRVGSGSGYWVQSADGNTLDRYKNVAGVATADPSVGSIPTTLGVSAGLSVSLLSANKMGSQRTVPPVDLANGYGAPTVASNGQVTYASGGAIKGSIYYLSGAELIWRNAGLPFTARLPLVSGTPASARLIQYNAANSEVGSRPTAAVIAAEIGFHSVVLNAATVKLQLELTTGGSSVVSTFMAVSLGEPATVVADGLYIEASGYLQEQLNEIPLTTVTYVFAQQGTSGTFVSGVLTQPAYGGAASSLATSAAAFIVGGKYRMRFRANSRLLQVNPATVYVGDINAFQQPTLAAKITEVPGDTGHFFYDLSFIIPAHPTVPAYPLQYVSLGFYSPAEGVVCDDFTASADYGLPPVRTPPLATRNYIAATIATALAAGGTVLTVPTAAVDLWGDSLIDFGHATGSVSDKLATRIGGGVIVRNLGVATQNAAQIASRAGGSPVLLSLVGNAIPATTTPVATTGLPPVCPITTASSTTNGSDPLAGTLGGIPGVLTSVRAGGAGAAVTGLTFTRNVAGSVVPVTPNSPFYPTAGEDTKSKIQILVWGKNDVGGSGGTATGGLIADLMDRQVRTMTPVNKQFLIGSVMHSNADTASLVIDDINNVLKARFPRNYVDLTSAPSTEEMATLTFTPNADDVKDMDCAFTGSITGSVLTVTAVASGVLALYKTIVGTDPATGIAVGPSMVITSLGTGTGGTGTYNLSASQAVPSIAMTALGFIPRGMRVGGYSGGVGVLGGDQEHINAIGNDLWSLRIYRAMKQLGYNIP